MRFENIRLLGKHSPRISVKGYDNEHMCEDIAVSGIYHNGKRITDLPAEQVLINEYCKNITIE